MSNSNHVYLVVASDLAHGYTVERAEIAAMTERHKLQLAETEPQVLVRPLEKARESAARGVVLTFDQGLPGREALALAGQAQAQGMLVYFYWPAEQAIEKIDVERLGRYQLHRRVAIAAHYLCRFTTLLSAACGGAKRLSRAIYHRSRLAEVVTWTRILVRRRHAVKRLLTGVSEVASARSHEEVSSLYEGQLGELLRKAKPNALPGVAQLPSEQHPFPATGVYLRLDFWAALTSGGSYGHTCYVAKYLARSSGDLVCFMANRYGLLEELGIRQIEIPPQTPAGTELNILYANDDYYQRLYTAMKVVQPGYIYERAVLGSFVGARLSQDLGIPYIVEYNGSEISMKRSFDGDGYEFEKIYDLAEQFAFAQATVISVVSDPIRESLVKRGVDETRIVVNPNGADTDAYAPPTAAQREAVRTELGFAAEDCVIGFTGTFGGWHGIDVLAEALPEICAAAPGTRFLLIGDGNYKSLIDDAVATHGLQDRCVLAGRVPQQEGARLLQACDIFVSPHSSHMVDGRFFGSPTKLFEYMAMAGGIVASDLEQIGEILRPAVTLEDLNNPTFTVSNERAVLCAPGDVKQFVAAVCALVARRDVCQALGRNARQAVIDNFSWQRHVERLWDFALTGNVQIALAREVEEDGVRELNVLQTNDAYKDEVQRQWNRDACGGQYVSDATQDTLRWYQEVERYRYAEYGPWMPEVMEFANFAGQQVLEIGAGIGTDLAQFARHGAHTTDLDLSAGHLEHARKNFHLRQLDGRFVHDDAERIPFDDGSFDLVYSNGVIHHTPNTESVIGEIKRVLKPDGRIIIMVYAEDSLHYWLRLFWEYGIVRGLLDNWSMGEIMSRHVELSSDGQKPLVKVYTRSRLAAMFSEFRDIEIFKRQLTRAELPRVLRWLPLELCGRFAGWNLIIKARKAAA